MLKNSFLYNKIDLLSIVRTKVNLLALAFCGISYCFWLILIIKQYYSFGGGWDTALQAQTLWSMTHGSLYNSVFGTNIFIDHCTFLSFLLAPFYWICPDPLLPQYFKLAAFFSGSYIFFLILKKRLDPLIALGAMIVFTITPGNEGMLEFSFNYEPFSIPLIFLIFKALDEKKYVLFIISCFLLCMVKEQMPLVVMMFGILACWVMKNDRLRWALIPFLMGLAIFIFDVFILMPHLGKGLPNKGVYYWSRYAQFGHNPREIIQSVLFHPLKAFTGIISLPNIRWYDDLFGVWGGLSLLSPQVLLPAFPLFIKTLFSNATIEHFVTSFYYASTFTPFIFLGAWNTLDHIQNKWRLPIHSLAIAIMLVHAVIFIPFWFPLLQHVPAGGPANILAEERFIQMIPPQASVLSTDSAMSFLTNRRELYSISAYLKDCYAVSGIKFILPTDTDYLLLNFVDGYAFLDISDRKYIPKFTALNFDDHWRLKGSIEDVALYEKNVPPQMVDRLIDKSSKPFLKNTGQSVNINNVISLQGLEFPRNFPSKYRIFPMVLYWKCLAKSKIFYTIYVGIRSDGNVVYEKVRLIGSTIYPTYFWSPGEYIKEKYFYLFPHLIPGKYTIEIKFYNLKSHQWVKTSPALKELTFDIIK